MNIRTGAMLGLLACLTGCQVWNVIAAPAAVRQAYFAPSVPFRHVHSDWSLFSGANAEQAVFRSQGDMEAFVERVPLNRAIGNHGRLASLPLIDFSKEMGVLVVAAPYGVVSSLEITAIEERADRLYVHSVHLVPSPRGGSLPAVSRASHYVAVARSDKQVEFAPIVQATQSLMPRDTPRSNEPFPSIFVPNAWPSPSTAPPEAQPTPAPSSGTAPAGP